MRNARYVSNDAENLLSRAKQPEEISPKTIFRVRPVPALDLEANMSLPLRAHVLKCRNGKHYVGISPAHKIQTRVQGHFSEEAMDASHFCAKNPPISVLFVWPVRHEAAEAYLFFVMMQALKCTDFRNLGGFVFTSSKPSPLVVMQLEQSRRQLEDRCFTCGGGHHAKNQKCPGPKPILL